MEKQVVEWQPDRSVSECPECHQKLGMLTRKHHCRLCGCVMCKDDGCSVLVTLADARRLVEPAGAAARIARVCTLHRL